MKHLIQEAFGNLTITDEFPSVIKKFKDVPSGHFVVRTAENVSTTLYYRVELVAQRFRKELNADHITQVLIQQVAQYLADTYGRESHLINFPTGFESIVKWHVSPGQVKKTLGTVQLIHGSSTARDGYTDFELYFPGKHFFRMIGNPDGRVTPSFRASYSGRVKFAGKDYEFFLVTGAAGPEVRGRSGMNYEQLVEAYRNQRTVVNYMSQQDAAAEMRSYIERWFSFIKDYDMLGEFEFYPPMSHEEAAANTVKKNQLAAANKAAAEDDQE